MKVAIATEDHAVSAHFGRCSEYTIVDIEDGRVLSKDVVANPGHEPGFLPKFLNEKKIQYIVAGGMGPRAINLFSSFGIEPVLGIQGSIDSVIDQFAKGTLQGSESLCQGHGHGHGEGESHQCQHDQ